MEEGFLILYCCPSTKNVQPSVTITSVGTNPSPPPPENCSSKTLLGFAKTFTHPFLKYTVLNFQNAIMHNRNE